MEAPKNTVLGDVRKLVHDAWEFFFPPMMRLAICAGIFWYLCGGAPLARLGSATSSRLLSLNSSAIIEVLDRYKLTALAPVMALFVISLVAYSINRLTSGAASLLPFTLSTSSGNITNSMIYGDPRWREVMIKNRTRDVNAIIDYLIAKARYEKHDSLLSGLESWQRNLGRAAGSFFFSKFLLAWAFACGVLSAELSGTAPFSITRLLLVVLLVVVFGLFSACDHAYALQQLNYSRIHIARVMLDAVNERQNDETTVNSEAAIDLDKRYQQVSQSDQRGWWSVRPYFTDRWEMLKHYDYSSRNYPSGNDRLWLQALLKTAPGVIWFVLAAVLILFLASISRWLGLALFIGYLTVTVLESITVLVTAVATFGRAGLARLKPQLPDPFWRLMPEEFWKKLTKADREPFWLTAAAVSVAEAIIAIIMSRVLANYLF